MANTSPTVAIRKTEEIPDDTSPEKLPPETLIDQLITLSGGPAPTAALDNMSVVRRDTILWDGDELSGAIARGRTVAALNLRDGDALVVPPQGAPWDRAAVLQIASFFIGPLITILVVR